MTNLKLVHDANGILDRRDRTIVHVRVGQHHVTQRRGLETMTIRLFLRHGETAVITIGQTSIPIVEVALRHTHVLIRLTTDVHTHMASRTFVLLEQLIALFLLGGNRILIAH